MTYDPAYQKAYYQRRRVEIGARHQERQIGTRPETQAYQRGYYQTHRTEQNEGSRKRHLAKYGLTVADYDQMLTDQGGRCKLCGAPPEKDKRLAVDHDHQTDEVRGLLCTMCNLRLGWYESTTSNEMKAFDSYLGR